MTLRVAVCVQNCANGNEIEAISYGGSKRDAQIETLYRERTQHTALTPRAKTADKQEDDATSPRPNREIKPDGLLSRFCSDAATVANSRTNAKESQAVRIYSMNQEIPTHKKPALPTKA